MTDDKSAVAVVPDSCTLIYASLDEQRADDISIGSIQAAKQLMTFIKEHDIGVMTEEIVANAANTSAATAMTIEEKGNFTNVIAGLKYVNYSRTQINKNMKIVEKIYEKAKSNFEEGLNELLKTKDNVRKSRKSGTVSKRKKKRWAKNIERKLNSPAYLILRKKLYDEPPDYYDKYMLSFGFNLRDHYKHVFIATEDTHMCPVFGCGKLGHAIYSEIEWRLGVKALQPYIVQREVLKVLKKAGALRRNEQT